MNRRRFLSMTAAAGTGALTTAQTARPQSPREYTRPRTGAGPFRRTRTGPSPHLFLISADMVSPDLYHPSRPFSRNVHTPALHSLMADGAFFENAFCTVPLCAPSRASYLTGRYSYIQGNGERSPEGLETQLRADDVIFPEYLRAAGYVARQVGKAHVGTAKFLDAFGENDQPWDRWSPPVFDDDDFLSYQHALGVQSQKYSREIIFKQQDRTSPGNSAGGWIVQENGTPFPLEAQYTYYLTKRATDTVADLVRTGVTKDHPLYFQLDIFDPHQPFSIPAGFEERERQLRSIMTLPASYERVRKRNFKSDPGEPEILDTYCKYWGIYEPQTLLDYRVAYTLQMEIVDHCIGLFINELKRLNLYEDAVIAFVSDHGEMNGRRATVDKGVYLFPDVLRVPLIIKAPAAPRGAIIHESVSLLDLSQTLLDAAGIAPDAMFDGVSLLPAVRGGEVQRQGRLLFFGGWHVGVNFACGLEHHTADGRHFLYAYNASSPNDELYEMSSEDAINLIHDPEYASVREEMIRELGVALQADPRWIGFWAEFRIARYHDLPRQNGDQQLFTKPS